MEMEDIIIKEYPNRVSKKTSKSLMDLQIDAADSESKNKKGISFYIKKENSYVFIPNNEFQ